MNENFDEQLAKAQFKEFLKKDYQLSAPKKILFLKKLIPQLGKKSNEFHIANSRLEELLDEKYIKK